MSDEVRRILEGFEGRRPAALARAVSIVENHRPGFDELLGTVHSRLGRARRIGLTGPPGAGKSTLSTGLTTAYRAANLTVGVIAVDPTSPFTGGALLGDRIRMESVALDPGVFIRSMATRGSLGGLAEATGEVADVFDAFGIDRVIIETVGVGQSELDVSRNVDSTVVVLVPESGDSIQTLKAGLMEIADVFVVNKADRNGTRQAVQELRQMLELSEAPWKPAIVETVATKGEGIDELWAAVEKHRAYQEEQGLLEARRRRRVQREIKEIVAERYRTKVEHEQVALLEEITDEVAQRRLDPYAAADRLVDALA